MPKILLRGSDFELGSYTISEEEIVGFAKQYDPVPTHTDKEAAATGPFGDLIASGFNALAIYQRLIVEAIWTQVAGIVGRKPFRQNGNLRTVESGFSVVGRYPAAAKLERLVTPATSMQKDLANAHELLTLAAQTCNPSDDLSHEGEPCTCQRHVLRSLHAQREC
jgi:hypothetical protein